MYKLSFILIFLIVSLSFAQVEDSLRINDNESKTAILFELNNLNLNTFKGGIGLKCWGAGQTAYIGKINFSVNKDKKEKSNRLMGEENSEILVGADFGIEKHFDFFNNISPYLGIMLGVGFEKIKTKTILSESTFYFFYPSYYNNEIKTTLISLSLELNFGIEYFLNHNISITGQYSLGVFYKFGKEEIVSNIVEESREISELNTGISSSSLILSVYF
jgi:hypothetical protein